MIEKAVREILTGDTTVSTLTGNRIRPLINAQNDGKPQITYQVSSDESAYLTTSGPSDFRKAVVELDIIAETFKDCVALSTETKRVLDGIGRNTSELLIVPSRLTDETDVEQLLEVGTEQVVFLRTQSFSFLYRPK